VLSCFRLLLRVRRLERRNTELRALVREMYDWTNYKHTRWARRARKALEATKEGV